MPCRSTPFRPFVLACAMLVAGTPQAAPRPLSDAQMSDVRGADGSILADLQSPSPKSHDELVGGLNAAFSSSTGATLLGAGQFAAALASVDLAPAMFADYAGQPVVQTVVDARPATFSFDVSDVLQSATGLQYRGGPSMGTITLRDFDARGTTIWVWHH
jgi:hypothetical protein